MGVFVSKTQAVGHASMYSCPNGGERVKKSNSAVFSITVAVGRPWNEMTGPQRPEPEECFVHLYRRTTFDLQWACPIN